MDPDLEQLINSSTLTKNQRILYTSFLQHVLNQPIETLLSASQALSSIPAVGGPSNVPLACLASILAARSGPWPILDLIRCHTRLWKMLPEETKVSGSSIADLSLGQVKASYRSLLDLFVRDSDRPALIDPHKSRILTHRALSRFIDNFSLPIASSSTERSRVAVALPNGSLLGLTCLAVATYYTAIPVNSTSEAEQFRTDVQQSDAKTILILRSDVVRLGLDAPWVKDAVITVLLVDQKDDLTFHVSFLDESPMPASTYVEPNTPDDIGFILYTSGTSGKKKLVPVTVHSIVSGVAFVGESWGLTEGDSCLNQMPLNHVGGLVRNLFAPIILGGSTICCSAFDANVFWDVVQELNPTWYYASPTMHSAILDVAADRPEAVEKCRMRLVCNAAGGLLPSLAVRLREMFRCTVLPSYGMTECMPISTPPLHYALDRPGTSGISCGPEIAILDGNDNHASTREVGRICVRGPPLFPGYLTGPGISMSAFLRGGWFDTGDMGYMDEDDYLYVTGRSKEVINRGGELISPFEVEEAIMTQARMPGSPIFERVSEVLTFSAPHSVLQEVVGVAIVTPPNKPRVDLRQLQAAVKSSLHQVKWPVTMVYMDALPKNNNKILRIKLADRLSMDTITDDVSKGNLHFEAERPPPNTALTVKIQMWSCQIDPEITRGVVQQLIGYSCDVYASLNEHDGLVDVVLAPRHGMPGVDISTEDLKVALQKAVHGYFVPSSIRTLDAPFPVRSDGTVDHVRVAALLQLQKTLISGDFSSTTERKIRGMFAELLSCSPADISADSDFFQIGGDSLKAGKLLSALRKEFHVRLPIGELFTNSTVRALCDIVDSKTPSKDEKAATPTLELPGCTTTCSSTNPLLLILQLLPIGILYPMKRSLEWTVFLYMLAVTLRIWSVGSTVVQRLFVLLVSIMVARAATQTVPPILAIICKWVLIGRFKEGMYPMWGSYHTRWWLVEKIIAVAGKGIFKSTNGTRVLYYRLLGAKIGCGVTIDDGTILGEYDLLDIGDKAVLDRCLCRPFAVERNTSMYLGRITIGRNCSIGLKATIAAGAFLPEDTCIGPNSSSWEWKDATDANRDLSPSKIAQPHALLQWLIVLPIRIAFRFVALLPWMGGLVGLVIQEPKPSQDMLRSVLIWFASPTRVAYHYLARILGTLFGPVVFMVCVVVTKRILDASFGKLKPGPSASRSHFDRFRMYLYRNLMPDGDLSKITENFGSHYEVTSILVRLLGGKVGSRVYWPGSGPSIQDYDFIDIGNDVVFGSRSHLVTSDGSGTQYVRVGDGAMVADRVILLPGSTLGSKTVFGSGALGARDTHYPDETVWVGSQKGGAICLSASRNAVPETRPTTGCFTTRPSTGTLTPGQTIPNQSTPAYQHGTPYLTPLGIESGPYSPTSPCSPYSGRSMSSASTDALVKSHAVNTTGKDLHIIALEKRVLELETRLLAITSPNGSTASLIKKRSSAKHPASTPFGRAFYEGKAPYHVLGLFSISLYSIATTVLVSVYWNVPTITAVQLVAKFFAHDAPLLSASNGWRALLIYGLMAAFVAAIMAVQSVLALALLVGAKWALMGRRASGSYDWDRSSYCQRWQLLLTLERLRRNCYAGNGILGLLTGTHYAVLYMRALGATIGADCALWAGGRPSLLFTEPDLLTLGDRVAVDDASLVAHINSRGNFSLNPLKVGDRSVLRSGSRLLSGAQMGADCCLLEHTLIMAGDVADDGATYQGWPADVFGGRRVREVRQ